MRSLTFVSALLVALALETSQASAAGDWTWPVRGEVVTPYRNGNDPYAAGQHRGIDIAAPVGETVVAASPGTIVHAGVVGSSGLVVSERTAGGEFVLSYLHLSSVAVRGGDQVDAGAPLGAVGVSGTRSTEVPHLHFGVRDAADRHAYRDPLDFLAPPAAPAPQPRPVPVAVPVGEPVLPAPVPGAVPVAAPSAPAPEPAHAPASVPVPTWRPLPFASPAPAVMPAETRSAAGSASDGAPARPALASQGPPRAPRAHAPSSGPGGPASAHPVSAPVDRRELLGDSGTGFDFGWLVACAGLVATAGLLARSPAGRGRRLTGRAAFAALLRAGSRG
jgi:hypothetical protein